MKTRRIVAALLLIFMLPCFIVPASANSAQKHWSGVDSTGAFITGAQGPVVVEGEKLTFDISEFPMNYYHDEDSFLQYSGRVTAEYNFFNPSDMTVTATLAFPFGGCPDYAYDYKSNDTNRYGVKVNGESVNATVRHTFSYPYSEFELEADLPRLSDEYIKQGIYSPDTTVTLYKWGVSGVEEGRYPSASIALDIPKGDYGRSYYLVDQHGASLLPDGDLRVSCWVNNKTEAPAVYLYVFGEPLKNLPTWKFYKDGGTEDGKEIGGTASFMGSESMTLIDFALENYDSQLGVSQLDWYNAVICDLTSSEYYFDSRLATPEGYQHNYEGYLMRWYEYEITLAPGDRLVNSVSAPIYPDIDGEYSPSVYGYTYLLSPASTWADFGRLDIVINTPYYLIDSNLEGFEKTENGYSLSLDGLPKEDGEHTDLSFSLCQEGEPTRSSSGTGLWVLMGILMLLFAPIGLLWQGIESVIGWIGSLFS